MKLLKILVILVSVSWIQTPIASKQQVLSLNLA